MSLEATVPGSWPNYPSTLELDQDRMPGPGDGQPLLSCSISTETTTCGSETDVVRKSSASDVETELDYETSSEGPFRLPNSSQSTETVARKSYPGESRNAAVSAGNPTENKSVQNDGTGGNQSSGDKTPPRGERGLYGEKIVRALTRPESMPALRNTLPVGDIKTQPGIDCALMSDSSLACQRKMRMIMAQMGLLLSAESNVATNSAGTSMTGFPCAEEEREQPKSQPPRFQTVDNELIDRPKEVSFRDLSESKRNPELRKLYPGERIGSLFGTDNEKPAKGPEEEGGLINIASNPHPSIKSLYIPPNPWDGGPTRDQEIHRRYPRVSNDLEALLRIDGELSPLRRELSQITGKFRALNLIPVDRGLTTRSSSGYFLHRSRSIAKEQLPTLTVIGKESREAFNGRPADNGTCLLERGSIPWRLADPSNSTENRTIKPVSANHEEGHYSANRVEYLGSFRSCCPDIASKDCRGCGRKRSARVIEDTKLPKRCASLAKDVKGGQDRNSSESVPRDGNFGKEASMEGIQGGSFKSGAAFREPRNCTHRESSTRTNLSSDSNQERCKNVHSYYKMSKDPDRNSSRLQLKCRQDSDRREGKSYLKITSSPKKSGETHLVRKRCSNSVVDPNVQSTERKSQMEAVFWSGARAENSHRRNSKTGRYPRDQNGSKGCLTIFQLDKTRRVDYTRFSSASLVVRTHRQKDTKPPVESKPFGQNASFSRDVRDLEIQCSRINLSHHRGEVLLGPSIKSLLRESVKGSSVRIPETEEKVIIVPLIFTNGVPEPPAVPIMNSSQGTSSSGREIARLGSRTTTWSRKDRSFGSSLGSTGPERVQDEAWESTCSMSTPCKDSRHNRSGSSPWSRIRTEERRSEAGREPSGVVGRQVTRPIRGMRSSPEDFLCDT